MSVARSSGRREGLPGSRVGYSEDAPTAVGAAEASIGSWMAFVEACARGEWWGKSLAALGRHVVSQHHRCLALAATSQLALGGLPLDSGRRYLSGCGSRSPSGAATASLPFLSPFFFFSSKYAQFVSAARTLIPRAQNLRIPKVEPTPEVAVL